MTDTIEKPAASSPEKFGALVPVAKPQSDKDWQDTFVACFEKMDSDNEAEAIDAFRKARHISRRIGTPFLSILKYEELRAINKQLGAQNVQLRREMAEMSRIVNRYTWLMNFGDVGKRARAHIKKYPFEYLIAATYASAYAFTGFCVEDILGFTLHP